jgi:hypothetical protein
MRGPDSDHLAMVAAPHDDARRGALERAVESIAD